MVCGLVHVVPWVVTYVQVAESPGEAGLNPESRHETSGPGSWRSEALCSNPSVSLPSSKMGLVTLSMTHLRLR